jgi:hypothetical protein
MNTSRTNPANGSRLLRSLLGGAATALVAASLGCTPDEGRTHDRGPVDTNHPVEVPEGAAGRQLKPSEVRTRCEASRIGPGLLRRLTRGELQATIEDVFPEIRDGWRGNRLSADPASVLGFSNDSAALLVGSQTASELLRTAEDVATLVSAPGTLEAVLPCASAGNTACAGEFVDQYGLRLFRRPLTAGERGEYLALFDSVAAESDFAMGIKWMLVALLQSPHAVYRSELGTAQGDRRQLGEYELATQLGYMFGGTTPDQELLGLAAAGQLSDPAVRAAQAARLIRTPRGLEVVREFFRAWLGYGSIVYAQRDQHPNFATEIAPHLIDETRFFIDQVVFQHGGDLKQLLQAPYTTLNAPLSAFYGFGGVSDGWSQVERPWGAGLLAQGSVLVSTAHERATSPTLRGLLVYKKLLCNDKILPPAIVPTLEESAGEANTTRELFEVAHLTKGSGCDNCHALFDPAGFTFEHFDETGRYREQENGFPIDASGNIPLADGTKVELGGFDDLIAQVDEVPQISDCLSGLMMAYMFSGGGGQTCLAEDQRSALARGDIGIEEYLLELTQAPHFTIRLR